MNAVPMTQPNQPNARLATGNYYTDLAASLHEMADRIATLADRDLTPLGSAHLWLTGSYSDDAVERYTPVVNAFADLFETSATTKVDKYNSQYEAYIQLGRLAVKAKTQVPKPTPKRTSAAKLREEIERLRAELARRYVGRIHDVAEAWAEAWLEQERQQIAEATASLAITPCVTHRVKGCEWCHPMTAAQAATVFPSAPARPQPTAEPVTDAGELPRLVEPAPIADPALDDDTVWMATRRRGLEFHRFGDIGSAGSRTVCGRATRTGEELKRRDAIWSVEAKPCVRCFPTAESTGGAR